MTTDPPPRPTEEERTRRRQQVFGDVLPDATSDDVGEDDPDPSGAGSDEWLRRQVPPHHG